MPTWDLFVLTPLDVGRDCVKSSLTHFPQAIPPKLVRGPEVVHGSGNVLERLSVHQECVGLIINAELPAS